MIFSFETFVLPLLFSSLGLGRPGWLHHARSLPPVATSLKGKFANCDKFVRGTEWLALLILYGSWRIWTKVKHLLQVTLFTLLYLINYILLASTVFESLGFLNYSLPFGSVHCFLSQIFSLHPFQHLQKSQSRSTSSSFSCSFSSSSPPPPPPPSPSSSSSSSSPPWFIRKYFLTYSSS